MRVSSSFTRCHWSLGLLLLSIAPALAGPPSDVLLPRTTVGYISIAHPAEFEERWNQTQFGQMLDDELMQPFVKDLRKQIQEKYRAVEEKLGITFEDLEGVPAGEMSLSIIERSGDDAALAITIDVTGREDEAESLLQSVEKRFAERGGQKTVVNRGGGNLEVFTVPADKGSSTQTTVYFIKDNVLCGIDDRTQAEAMLNRFAGNANDNLRSVPAYAATMDRCRRQANGLAPEARWFVEPFGLVYAARTLQKSSQRQREQDTVRILQENGFDAIKGAGGFFNQLVDGGIEFLHRASVYAPPVPGKESDPLRWNLSMRMLQLPNTRELTPQAWVPRTAAGYTTFLLDIDKSFGNVGPVFDALQGHEDAWANTLEGWETDPYGPQVNVRKEFIGNMGQRISILADYQTPITVDSERSLFAIEAKNEEALAEALEKWMTKEPDVVRRDVGKFVIWERVPPQLADEEAVARPPGFTRINTDPKKEDKDDKDNRNRVLPNSAVCVALGHMMMASDVDYLKKLLEGMDENERLADTPEYRKVSENMEYLSPGERSGWSFGRTDDELRPTFELLRQGKMPQAKTMLGKFLNNLLLTEEEREDGTIRKQQIDGSNLPDFED
ncbi:MAG TPA: hypothetical protein VGK58_04505, partial [Lacipirellulaceae bacterium]